MSSVLDPREELDKASLSSLQITVIIITIGLNALDGFDVLSISFALPGIAEEWGTNRAALGIVASMELIGMGIGSICLGSIADKIGRRPTVLSCLTVMCLGMFMVTTVDSIFSLSAWRVFTGIGIGGMLASINAIAAEFSNKKSRYLCISIMAIGYPIGGVLGGTVASYLLGIYDWRSVFYFGSAVTLCFIPLFYFVVPESVHWLVQKQPVGALERVNNTLQRIGHSVITALPVVPAEVRKKSSTEIFSRAMIATTVLISLAYFCQVMTLYFILKWVPTIVVDLGYTAAQGGKTLVWANVGGALGGLTLGLLSMRYNLKGLTVATLFLATVFIIVFGYNANSLIMVSILCACAGFFINGAIVGMYGLFAQVFPTHVRAFGTGFAIGFGRGGAVLSPLIVGFMFTGGFGLPTISIVMGVGSLLAAVTLLFLKADKNSQTAEN